MSHLLFSREAKSHLVMIDEEILRQMQTALKFYEDEDHYFDYPTERDRDNYEIKAGDCSAEKDCGERAREALKELEAHPPLGQNTSAHLLEKFAQAAREYIEASTEKSVYPETRGVDDWVCEAEEVLVKLCEQIEGEKK